MYVNVKHSDVDTIQASKGLVHEDSISLLSVKKKMTRNTKKIEKADEPVMKVLKARSRGILHKATGRSY